MSWKNRLRKASFRNVKFGVEEHESEQGRRVIIHEYPGRDKPYVEELGQKAKVYNIRGFVVGSGYMGTRDALVNACNAAGSGQLVHPYLGTMRVKCRDVTFRESAKDGGMAIFEMSFVEEGENKNPTASLDKIGQLLDMADNLDSVLADFFTEHFDLSGLPDWLSINGVNSLTDRINRLSELSAFMDIAKQSGFLSSVGGLLDSISTVVKLPGQLVGEVLDLFTDVTGSFNQPSQGISALKDAFRAPKIYSSRPVTPPYLLSATEKQALKNEQVIGQLFETAALSAAVATVVARPDDIKIIMPRPGGDFDVSPVDVAGSRVSAKPAGNLFESLDGAIEQRDDFLAWLDDLALVADDRVYMALQDLRVSIINTIPDAETDLPRLMTYKPEKTLPVLVLAYSLHGDSGRAGEILRHNTVAHPGFMPTTPLRILSD